MSYTDGLLYSFLCLQETSLNISNFEKFGACNVKMDVRLPLQLKCFTGSFAVKLLSSLAPLARAVITTYSNQITKVVNAISRMNFPRLRWHFKVRYMARNSCCFISRFRYALESCHVSDKWRKGDVCQSKSKC